MARRRYQDPKPRKEGRWWYLLYRQDVVENGRRIRKRKREKLALATTPEREVRKIAAERLRPLVEGARSGSLDDGKRAELERLLLAYWRQRRDLQDVKIGAAIATLRRDREASPLFLKLEEWLHRPQPSQNPQDLNEALDPAIAALLEPYRNAPDVGDPRGEKPSTEGKESA